MNKEVLIIAVILALILIVGFYILNSKKKNPDVLDSNKSITLSEISNHSSPNDCWTVIDGKVYDISNYITNHPGGSRITSACGIDATSLFNGSSQKGVMHSQIARSILSKMKIGNLSN